MNAQRRIVTPSAEVVELVKRFGVEKGPRRIEALQALQERGAAGTNEILALLEREEVNRSILYRFSGLAAIGTVVGIACFGNAALHSRALIPVVFLFLIGWFAAMMTIGKSFMQTKAEKYAKAALICMHETLEDVRAAGPLLEAYGEFLDPNLNTWDTLALTRLLSRFGKAEAGILNIKQKTALNKLLEQAVAAQKPGFGSTLTTENAALLEAALTAARYAGDADTLTQVKRLADMPANTPEQKRVRAAASAILSRLQERTTKKRGSGIVT